MRSMLYPRLALTNLRNNKSTYLPYMLVGVVGIVTFYTMTALCMNEGLGDLPGGEVVTMMFSFGPPIIGLFCTILLFYTNSFLMKRRKKELGLYCVLGMEKRHIGLVMLWESVCTAAVCLALGLVASIVLGKLLFLVLLNLLHVESSIPFEISPMAMAVTAGLFLVIYLLTFLYNLVHVSLTDPIRLLHGGEMGEKEPKSSVLITVLGVLCLGGGYGVALMVPSPLQALALFFVAVILVIIGTFCLFTSGSIAFLKLLRRNKDFYYQPNHFISVSGMLYRMKQNAAGLASICILSTMVLITFSTTVCLYAGKNDMLNGLYPQDARVHISACTPEEEAALAAQLPVQSAASGVEVENMRAYRSRFYTMYRSGDVFCTPNTASLKDGLSQYSITALTQEEYEQIEGTSVVLSEGEVLVFFPGQPLNSRTITLNDWVFQVKEEVEDLSIHNKASVNITPNGYIILKDEQTLRELTEALTGKPYTYSDYEANFDLAGTRADQRLFEQNLLSSLEGQVGGISVRIKATMDYEWYSLYGSFLFLGIFCGSLFAMATVLIIYYKQVSEGYEDHDRFLIMQKVGMSRAEVRRTISAQVLLVFFLPLAVAVLHVAVAFPAVTKIMLAFGLSNQFLFFLCTAGSVLVFAVVYILVYRKTAKTYYRLVAADL